MNSQAPMARHKRLTPESFQEKYSASLTDPEAFWAEYGKRLDWIEPYTKVKNTTFAYPDVSIKWFEDGILNVSANCIDRHLPTNGDKTALIWEPDNPQDRAQHISFRQLHDEVCRFANVLKDLGVKKGDRVTIYLPMIPAATYAMLACARIGAPHSVVFAGFSPDALAGRINDADSTVVITADEGRRGGKPVPLKANVDKALEDCPGVSKVLVVENTGGSIAMKGGRDVWWHDAASGVEPFCAPEPMNAEDPLFILYTSGSTGKPKGVLHTTGGYLVWASLTHEMGDRAQLYRLRAAGQWRHLADVRGRSQLARPVAVLAGRRSA